MLRLTTWDVQHGSAALLQTPNGQRIAIDLGSDDNFSPLRHIWTRLGITRLDEIIITHPHMDHIEDILNLNLFNVRILRRPRHLTAADIVNGHSNAGPNAVEICQKYLELNDIYIHPVEHAENPEIPSNNGGVSIKTFYPTRSSKTNLNNHSIVTVIEYEGVKILSPGDNESPSWEELLEDSAFTNAIVNTHVLVAPHHGRDSGFHPPLFDHIDPLLTVISDGRVVDTSATARYTARSRGWSVSKRSGGSEQRKCLTTRNDGRIEIVIAPSTTGSGIGSLYIDID